MITYCSNIHPGESFEEIFNNLQTRLLCVKEVVSTGDPFPIGLRLSNRASQEIDPEISSKFHAWCQENGCFVPTINGFSYGPFASLPVKENVYLPDWRDPERVRYSKRLAALLDSWLPMGMIGSISTVPIGFKANASMKDRSVIRRNVVDVLEHLDRLRQKSGKEIVLSLEPEPGCLLETMSEVVLFFEEMAFPKGLRDGLGVCLDCCHQAVEFEEPSESLSLLLGAGIRLGKVQISSALRMVQPDRSLLERFCEPVYLHQVVIRNQNGTLARFNDLPEALRDGKGENGEEWRIHFHLPIFLKEAGPYQTTRFFIEKILPLLDDRILLEVETYTWEVLPPELQTETLTQSIVREMEWLRTQSDEANGRT